MKRAGVRGQLVSCKGRAKKSDSRLRWESPGWFYQVPRLLLRRLRDHCARRVKPPHNIWIFAHHRMHYVPVARLFETKGALLHLGLNPKGKPGLWQVQKTH